MPSGFSAQHFAKGATINDLSPSTTTTYSSSKIDQKIASAGGGGSSTFLALTDTPSTFSAGQTLRVNAGGTALEYYTPAGGVTIDDATVSTTSVYSSNKIDTTYVQQSKVKNSNSTTAGDVYDVRHVNTELAGKANTSHTHVINDVTNLQTSLDAKVNTSQVKNANSTTAGDVYDVRYVDAQLATKASGTHTHVIADVTNLQTSLDAKLETSNIQTTAEGDSTSEADVYSCNSVFSKSEVGNSLQTKTLKVHGTSGAAGYLNLGSDQTSGVYFLQQTYQGNNRTSMQTWATSATSDTNVSWWFNRVNSLRELIRIRPQDSAKFQILDGGGIHAEGYLTTDQTSFTANNQVVTKQFVDTSIANLVNSAPSTLDTLNELAAALGNDANFSTTVTNSIATKLPLAGGAMTGHITTNQTTFSNNNELVTKQYVDTQDALKLSLTGGAMTGHITTNQTTFSNNNEIVTKQYVDTRLPTDVNTPITYNIQNAVTDQNYVFGINGAANAMALVEIPKIYTGVPASSRGVRVGFEGGDYGSGMIAVGYEALADSTGSAGQTNAVRSVAIGYQAGYHAQAANHGIYIGPYQGYQLSTHNQLRIGNSGVSPTTTGYDKAIIEGTMGTTDSGQTLRLNADTIYLGSSLPTSQPVDNRLWLSNGNLSIGAVSSGGGSTYLSLTDTPASHSANSLLYSTGSAIAHTTSEILIDGNGVEVNQLNARVNNTSNIGDSSHRFNTVHCLAVQSTSGKLILPTSSGSVGQVLSIASLNGSDMTLAFSTASGGGGGSTTALPSYPSNANGPTDNTLQYIGIGDRTHHMRVWAEGVGGSSNTYTPNVMTHVNGVRNDSGNGFGALNMPVGSSVVYSWEDGSRYPFTKMTWQMHWPLGTAVSNSGTDFRFLIGGSNDNVNWTWLGAFSPDNHSFTPPAPFASVTNYTNSGNYTATSTSYYTSNTVSSASNSAYARTFHFTNTTGYRLYRIKILDNPSSSVYNTNGGNRNLYVEFAEIEWG